MLKILIFSLLLCSCKAYTAPEIVMTAGNAVCVSGVCEAEAYVSGGDLGTAHGDEFWIHAVKIAICRNSEPWAVEGSGSVRLRFEGLSADFEGEAWLGLKTQNGAWYMSRINVLKGE